MQSRHMDETTAKLLSRPTAMLSIPEDGDFCAAPAPAPAPTPAPAPAPAAAIPLSAMTAAAPSEALASDSTHDPEKKWFQDQL